MSENYEILTQREIADVDPNSGDLLDYWEVTARAIPSGAHFAVRVPMAGATAADVAGKLEAKAKQFADLEAL